MKRILVIIFLSFLLGGCSHFAPKPQNSTYENKNLGDTSFNAIAYHYSRQYKKYSSIGETKDLAQNSALDNCYKSHPASPNFCKVYSYRNNKLKTVAVIGPEPGKFIAANSRSCFNINGRLSGTDKICSYNCTGDEAIKNIKSAELCTILINPYYVTKLKNE